MKSLFLLIFLLLIIVSCSNKNTIKKKSFDTKRFLDSLPEPLLSKIPDPTKKWVPVLDTVRKHDQKYRSIDEPDLLEKNKKEQNKLDEENQKIVTDFINKYGYPTPSQVGIKGMMAVNLVIQHSPLNMQEQYYHNLCDAYKKGTVSGETFALVEDRINVRNHRRQYYGTQFFMYNGKQTPFPVINVDSLYTFRKRLNMPWTMEQYLKTVKSSWDSAEYKKLLPEIIKYTRTNDSVSLHYIK